MLSKRVYYMANGNNYIEDFFISIGFDTKKVQKDVNEINKILGKLGKGVGNKPLAPVTPKPRQVKNELSIIDKALQKTRDKEIKREMDLHKIKVNNIKKEEKARNDAIKAQRMGDSLKYTRSYQQLKSRGKLGDFDERIGAAVSNRNIGDLKNLKTEMNSVATATRGMQRQMLGLGVVQRGLNDSTRNMIRSYASVFALFQGTVAIKRIGQDFEGMEAGLNAVSKDAADAAKNLEFLRKESMRLGFDMVTGSKAYVKLFAAAEGKATKTELEESFVSIMEAATVFQLSMDDTTGTIKAIQQMFSKAGIMAQEFKEQLGDRMPIAMRALEKSTGKTAKELFKMMEMGQLGAEYIVPFTKALGELADQNDALEKSLATSKKQEDRMINTAKIASKTIFDSGFSEGLSELYKVITKLLTDSGDQLKKIGKIFGALFKAIAHGLVVLEPFMKVFIDNFELMFGAYAIKMMSKFATAANVSLARAFLPITLALAAAEELASLMSDKLVGSIERMSGRQFNIADLTSTKLMKDDQGRYVAGGEKTATAESFRDSWSRIKRLPSASSLMAEASMLTAGGFSKGVSELTSYISVNIDGQEVAKHTESRILNGASVGASK